MALPFDIKPFPIPVVALGPGSQSGDEDESLNYIAMPQGMSTFRAPPLPEPEELAGHAGAVSTLHEVLARLQAVLRGEAVDPVRLDGLAAADLALINQVLGEGEVSAQVLAEPGRAPSAPRAQIQESVFAGVWRVIERCDDGRVLDTIEVGAVPALLHRIAAEDTRPVPPEPAVLPMLMGVLVTPWFMNVLRLPVTSVAEAAAAGLLPVGVTGGRRYGEHHLDFVGAHEPTIGAFEQVSLFSPMFSFADQPAAVATAREVLRLLRQSVAASKVAA